MAIDKKTCVDVVEIAFSSSSDSIIARNNKMTCGEWMTFLGTYKSKERALDVLNNIFETIEQNGGKIVTYRMPEK